MSTYLRSQITWWLCPYLVELVHVRVDDVLPVISRLSFSVLSKKVKMEERPWDPFKTFNVSAAERDLIDRRRKTRDKFRAEYRKILSDPRTTTVVSSNFLLTILCIPHRIFFFFTDAWTFELQYLFNEFLFCILFKNLWAILY